MEGIPFKAFKSFILLVLTLISFTQIYESVIRYVGYETSITVYTDKTRWENISYTVKTVLSRFFKYLSGTVGLGKVPLSKRRFKNLTEESVNERQNPLINFLNSKDPLVQINL